MSFKNKNNLVLDNIKDVKYLTHLVKDNLSGVSQDEVLPLIIAPYAQYLDKDCYILKMCSIS